MPVISIEQWSAPVHARKGTILDAALAAGVPFPHSCRAGECGACKSRLLAGEVFSLEGASPLALTEEERAGGLILACRSWPKGDISLAWLSDAHEIHAMPVRRLKAGVVGAEHATHDIRRIRLELVGPPLAFDAGQYAKLRFGRLPARSYSMANRPDERVLEFHIRHVSGGAASGYVTEHLRLGETVEVEGPFGTAYLRPDHDGPIIAAAGGSGLAPIKSIVRTALANGFAHPIHLYFGARDERDIYDEGELLALARSYANLRIQIVLSTPGEASRRRTGFVHDALAADLKRMNGAVLYVAGPPPMVDAVRSVATERGVTASDIHADPFVASASPTPRNRFARLSRLFG